MAELSLVVKATLVLGVALLAARLSGRASAAVRSLMLACAFGLLLLLPVVSTVLPARAIELPAYSMPFEQAVTPPAAAVTGASVTADVPTAVLPARSGMPSLRAVLLVVWAAGVVACAAPLVVGLFRLRRLRTHGRPWREAALPSSVEVLLHDEVRVPVTCGVFRPVIALPVDAPQWPGSGLRRVLLHELEHVRRRDWPVHLAARGICALYWFHPLVWSAWRRLCLESERACDDAVLREEDGTEYAAQLVALARRVTKHDALPLLSMAGRSNLSTRIGAMLAGNLARGPVRGVPAAALAGLAAMAALGLGPLQAVSSIQQSSGQAARESTGPRFQSTSIVLTAVPLKAPRVRCCAVRYSAGGQVSGDNVGLLDLIGSAHDVYTWWQIDGAPAWADYDNWADGTRFDVRASARRDASTDDMRQMLKTMLADRFRLAVHRETRTQKVYELVVEPTGHKLQPPGEKRYAVNEDVWMRADPTTLIATLQVDQMTMAQLAKNLSGPLFTMVVDRTGLTGTYRVEARWDANPNRAANAPTDPARPTIFEAFPAQLGLRLREATGPVEFLVVDRAERPTLGVVTGDK